MDLLVKLKILIVSVLSCLILQALLQKFADLSVFYPGFYMLLIHEHCGTAVLQTV